MFATLFVLNENVSYMKNEKDNGQPASSTEKGQRDDIRNSDAFNKNEKRENHPGKDRVAKTERSGWGQQQDSSDSPINS